MMNYQVDSFAWELTMACNMRCRHCASACGAAQPDQLTTEEALKFCRDVAALKPRRASLVGGEPLLREDWPLIAKELSTRGIQVDIVTNGALLCRETAETMRESGIGLVSLSIDGPPDIHNAVRGNDCYDQCAQAYEHINRAGMHAAANTTVLKENIDTLEEMRENLIRHGVKDWQLQSGVPYGNLCEHRESVIVPQDLDRLINFAYEANLKGGLRVHLADGIGYYTRKETAARQMAMETSQLVVWGGCHAGINAFGLLHNGDVTGCVSIRDGRFIEGNIRARSIRDIWEDETAFAWRRRFDHTKLTAPCADCEYAGLCLGGCVSARLAFCGDLYNGNVYCVYAGQCNKR